jgi:hypothetical protein
MARSKKLQVGGLRQHPVLGAYRGSMAVLDESDRTGLYRGEPSVWCGWCFLMMAPHSVALHEHSEREMRLSVRRPWRTV